jgi:hypothetical protein
MDSRFISEGPAVVEWNGFKYYTEGTLTLEPDVKLREIVSAMFGPVDSRVTDKMFSLGFTPIGMMNNNAASYYPFGIADLGKLLMPDVDLPIYIWTSGGEKVTVPAGIISKCPQALLGTDIGPFGQMSLAGLRDYTVEDAADEAHYKIEEAELAEHTLDPDKAPTPAYKAVITTPAVGEGEPTVVEIDGDKGFTFDYGATLKPRGVNRYGTTNFKLSALKPTIAFQPFGLSISDIMAYWNIQGSGAAKMGGSNRLGKSLTVKPANDGDKGITVVFPDFKIQSGSMLFGSDDPRHGQYVFTPVAKVVAGVMQPLCTVTFPTWA